LKIAGDKVALDLGQGLEIPGSGASTNKLAADLGAGLKFSGNEITADLGAGIVFSGNEIAADLGAGLVFSGNEIAADVGNGLKIFNNVIQPDYAATETAGKVCGTSDPRLSDVRTPKPHKSAHQDGGADEIDVNNLSGVLSQAQRVTVQEDGEVKGTQTVLNFRGNGVSVNNDTGENPQRINIDIPGAQAGKVTTGLMFFNNMSAGEVRTSPFISHGLEADLVAFIVGLEDAVDSAIFGDLDLFDPGNPPAAPKIGVFRAPTPSRKFRITVRQGGKDSQYNVRWWAIPMTQDEGRLNVPPVRIPEPGPIETVPRPGPIVIGPGPGPGVAPT
jgi:hypothetical protein